MTTTEPPSPRIPTEAEARAASVLFWSATQFARMTVAQWNLRDGKPPSKDEMLALAMDLRSAEEAASKMFSGPPSDGHAADHLIDYFGKRIEKLAQRAAPASPPDEEPVVVPVRKKKKPWSSANSRSYRDTP